MKKNHSIDQEASKNFALRFRLLMSYHDLTLKDIADHTKNAIATVGTWKNGRIPCSASSIKKLAELFGVSENFLMEGIGENGFLKKIPPADLETLLSEVGKSCATQQAFSFVDLEHTLLKNNALDPSNAQIRQHIEVYFSNILTKAAQTPWGLMYVLIRLKKEFPPSLFE